MSQEGREPDPTIRTEGETLDMPEGMGGFAPGQVLGERYQILEMLGRGGMGEVWHAFDLKLRVEVALKALRSDLFKSERRLELLRQEVRAAREVVSPNVCRIFDLIEIEGLELVSMEYVDGATLLGVLQERGPLELKEAQDIASQFLAGIEAIHKVGLIHRDIKPENIMLTRAGRVVVMDFGLARQEAEGGGSVSGTPAYMAPEQAAGQTLDARADVYSAGVVLAEMMCPEGIKSFESRQSVWEGVRSEPAKLPDSPWAPVLKKAVAKDREQRYHTAHTLTRALEDVTLRVESAEDLHPYPGLASFTEEDAEYFFGREAEIEQMWRKLERTHLLAIVGSSGAGKTSFIGAGLTPNTPDGWVIARCTPGNAVLSSLRKTLIYELAGDAEALGQFVDSDSAESLVTAASRWREGHKETLLVVDQFEELFTQNPEDEQTRFATLVGRLVVEADVRVLLSMRDDFLIHCSRHESLRPLFSELTPLDAPIGAALRRALTQPALKCGYRFEDDELTEEMLAEVEGERGALPLLAFAAAQLWEKRDRETGLLTREAYHDIGGIGGALAQHAEGMIDRIGADRIGIVRELFRNLVTAEGTRAVREWNELLSVFDTADVSRAGINPAPTKEGVASGSTFVGEGFIPAPTAAEEVLRELIDARLLTSYEVREEDAEPTRRVEIIHESLLTNWPRLVRWQTQDAEGARIRDELRQAARVWDEHGRHDDRLWTGIAFREYKLWRERYPGGLTKTEEDFATAMTSLATRRRRRRRTASTLAVSALVAVLVVVTGLWRQSVRQTRRAEASKLVTLGQAALEKERTEALAYAIASLQLADTSEARMLALRSLWEGPPATISPNKERQAFSLAFSPDGNHLAVGYGWEKKGQVVVFPRDGGPAIHLRELEGNDSVYWLEFSADGGRLVGSVGANQVPVWRTDTWQLEKNLEVPDAYWVLAFFEPSGETILSFAVHLLDKSGSEGRQPVEWVVQRWPLRGGSPLVVGTYRDFLPVLVPVPDFARGVVPLPRENVVELHRLDSLGGEPGRVVARYPQDVGSDGDVAFDPLRDRLALTDSEANLRLWSLAGDGSQFERSFEAPKTVFRTRFSPDGSLLAQAGGDYGGRLWDLEGPTGAEPLQIDKIGWQMNDLAFSPDGQWFATAGFDYNVTLWPLTKRYNRVLRGHDCTVLSSVFSPDGSHYFTIGMDDGKVLSWDMSGGAGRKPTVLFEEPAAWSGWLSVDPRGRFLMCSLGGFGTQKIPLDEGDPTPVDGLPDGQLVLDPTGRFAASIPGIGVSTVVVVDLESGESWELEEPGDGLVSGWAFDRESRLLVARGGVLSRWDPATRETEILLTGESQIEYGGGAVASGHNAIRVFDDGRIYVGGRERSILDPEDGTRTVLPAADQPQRRLAHDAFDPAGSVVATGRRDGVIEVGLVSSDERHLLVGHETAYVIPQVSPDGRWIASAGQDGTLRLWPMPDLSKRPLHTLPYHELMTKLETLTNLRIVPDPEEAAGYRLTSDPTAWRGWAEVPEW